MTDSDISSGELSKTICVLLIEDNMDDVILIQRMLSKSKRISFNIERAERLKAGLDRLEEQGIDVVILDLGLPDSKGLNTLAKLYARIPEVPIIVMTILEGPSK